MKEYCHWDRFNAECGPEGVVIIDQAQYGRMAYGKCVERDYGYVGCYKDVLPLADARCSGRRSCEIRIPDEVFDTTKPCPKDLSRYLTASYRCVKGRGLYDSSHIRNDENVCANLPFKDSIFIVITQLKNYTF